MHRPKPILFVLVAVPTTAAAVWAWKRWGYRVRAVERDVARPPKPPPTPEPAGPRAVQHQADGVGAHYYRRYRVDVADAEVTPEDLMARIGRDIQPFVPAEIAVFHKSAGAPDVLAVGDEFDIQIWSPWDGPVRVAEVTPTGFCLKTLEGHLEAGEIRFLAAPHPTRPGALRFTIESWARSADAVVDVVYDGIGVAKEAQQAMWTFFCERVADAVGGTKMGEITALTERAPGPDA